MCKKFLQGLFGGGDAAPTRGAVTQTAQARESSAVVKLSNTDDNAPVNLPRKKPDEKRGVPGLGL